MDKNEQTKPFDLGMNEEQINRIRYEQRLFNYNNHKGKDAYHLTKFFNEQLVTGHEKNFFILNSTWFVMHSFFAKLPRDNFFSYFTVSEIQIDRDDRINEWKQQVKENKMDQTTMETKIREYRPNMEVIKKNVHLIIDNIRKGIRGIYDFVSYLMWCGECRVHAIDNTASLKEKEYVHGDDVFNDAVDFHNKVNQMNGKPSMTYEEARDMYDTTDDFIKNKKRLHEKQHNDAKQKSYNETYNIYSNTKQTNVYENQKKFILFKKMKKELKINEIQEKMKSKNLKPQNMQSKSKSKSLQNKEPMQIKNDINSATKQHSIDSLDKYDHYFLYAYVPIVVLYFFSVGFLFIHNNGSNKHQKTKPDQFGGRKIQEFPENQSSDDRTQT